MNKNKFEDQRENKRKILQKSNKEENCGRDKWLEGKREEVSSFDWMVKDAPKERKNEVK